MFPFNNIRPSEKVVKSSLFASGITFKHKQTLALDLCIRVLVLRGYLKLGYKSVHNGVALVPSGNFKSGSQANNVALKTTKVSHVKKRKLLKRSTNEVAKPKEVSMIVAQTPTNSHQSFDSVKNTFSKDSENTCKWVVYILQSESCSRYSYVGATTNVFRRLRQHNGEIKGGAKYTSRSTLQPWFILATVSGFHSEVECLQFEWAIKHKAKGESGRNRRALGTGPKGRINNLIRVLCMDKWTSRAIPAKLRMLTVHWWDIPNVVKALGKHYSDLDDSYVIKSLPYYVCQANTLVNSEML